LTLFEERVAADNPEAWIILLPILELDSHGAVREPNAATASGYGPNWHATPPRYFRPR
jgi:hypothetical protein